MTNQGDRVGAIFGSDEEQVEFLGYGVYDGEHVPLEAVGFLADGLKKNSAKNPRILLDSGSYVYGCECWWGPEQRVKEMISKFNIVEVNIDDIRKEHTQSPD